MCDEGGWQNSYREEVSVTVDFRMGGDFPAIDQIFTTESIITAQYQLVFRQTLPYLYAQDELRLNTEDPSSDNYAILDELERFRREDGRFYFRMVWPGDDTVYEWSQTSNPVSES